ncbi:PREDICTED: lipase 1-like [Papilio xuthus]|uniref:Lipase n=1 Tax=Papilio xuthus TaxID=66420 RepID=A0A194QBS0_PAPXU|nr:PREDICTED: lipase 1-like [Papilio xuthus]KPJ03003.1 Lipase 1 [Papilio xuthus]
MGYPPDSLDNFTELATKYGYVSEEHTVTTEDGYILTMFRITKGKNCNGPIRKPPVILMHGLLMSSDCFLDAGQDAGLAYLISDLCYDLWVPNVRGNYYSKRHIDLDPATDNEFWDFSNLEFGYYDVPAFIDYILSKTKSKKLNYVGFSQGCSSFSIMNAERQEYNDKIGVAILIEPSSRQTNMRSQLTRLLFSTAATSLPALTSVGHCEVLSLGGIVQEIAAFLCKDYIAANTLCRVVMSSIDASHPGSVTTQTMRVLFGHFPAGTSTKNLAWYGQGLNTNTFQNFDYGVEENLQIYGSDQPPPYNLSQVTVPIVIINGNNDGLATPADVDWLTSKLPNVLEHFLVQDPLWDHLDVVYSQYTRKSILPKISQYLRSYSTYT